MAAKHIVVVPAAGGGVQSYPLKSWVRSNPDVVDPAKYRSSSTSHQMRGMLKHLGWTLDIQDDVVSVIHPDINKEASDQFTGEATSAVYEDSSDIEELSFELEYQLRDFLVSNLTAMTVADKYLSLFRDQNGRDGREYHTDVGLIDILAEDKDGNLYVFELKRASAPDKAMGQLTRYMGWLKVNHPSREIFGIIVAKEISDNLRYAACAVPNVFLFAYSIEFSLSVAGSPQV